MAETLQRQSNQWSFTRRLVTRWAVVFVGLLLLACAEGIVLWWNGFRYQPPSAFVSVTASDLAVVSHRDRIAAVVSFSQHSKDDGLWRDIVVMNADLAEPVRLHVDQFAPRCVAMSPESDLVVFAGDSGMIFSTSVPPHHQSIHKLPPVSVFAETGSRAIERLVYSPDARYLAAADRNSIFLWDWPAGRLIHRFPHSDSGFKSIVFSPDSQVLFSPRDPLGPCLFEIQSGEVIDLLSSVNRLGHQLVWSFERHLIASVRSGKLSVCRYGCHEELWTTLTSHSAPVAAFGPEGRLLAYVRHTGCRSAIHICEAESGLEIDTIDTRGSMVKGLAFSQNGRLYSWDMDGRIAAWDKQHPIRNWSIQLADWAARDQVRTR